MKSNNEVVQQLVHLEYFISGSICNNWWVLTMVHFVWGQVSIGANDLVHRCPDITIVKTFAQVCDKSKILIQGDFLPLE